jgi:Spy/CpxP family protein refolding chaperone
MKTKRFRTIVAMMILSLGGSIALAQNNQGQPGQQGQGPGGFGQGGFGQGNFQQPNPQEIQQRIGQFRQQQLDQYKESLGASDEEWTVLRPKIEKVRDLMEASGGGLTGILSSLGRGMGRRGGGQQQMAAVAAALNGGQQQSPLQVKMQLLNEAMSNKDMPETEVRARLASVREERDRVRADLNRARAELTELLTPRQEATLFQMGMLE